tara:strand:+ start:1911 stop:2867 length:957 start_codon:yes stop_codon:yes gene_type:complete
MPRGTWNLEWLNHNSQRSYPLAEDATKVDSSGTFEVPDNFIVELYFPVQGTMNVDPSKFFLRSIAIFASGYNIAIAYNDDATSPTIVSSVNIPKSTHTENTSYALAGTNDFDDSVGKIVIGKIDALELAGEAQYTFTYDDGKLDPDTIRPMIRGISSIVLINGTEESERLYGDIELQAGTNIRLTPIVYSDGSDPKIRIDAITGEGLVEDCVCDDEPDSGPGIRRINGVPPTASGDFTLLGDDCLEISPITHGLQLRDICSDPCCGCAELEAVVSDLERFGEAATTLRNFVNRLEAEVSQFHSVVLGSRLNDRGCLEC